VLRAVVLLLIYAGSAFAQSYTLAESFDTKSAYRVELRANISGVVTLPGVNDKPSALVNMTGKSQIVYDERPLADEDATTRKTVRAYRVVEFTRKFGDTEQKATIREPVRRMIVLRSEQGKKAPFSPEGALTYSEIDVVKNDLFSPTLVAGLLPKGDVKVGDTWKASNAAIMDLTDLDTIEDGELKLELTNVVTVNNRQQAKIAMTGSVRGTNEDGPNRQKIEGTIYFDIDRKRLSYMKLSGTHELLNKDGKSTGKIEGTFVMAREEANQTQLISEDALKGIDLKPSEENSMLLFDNPDLGISFKYPRRWRVGVVQGRQITLEESQGGAILMTVCSAANTPSVKLFQEELRTILDKQKAKLEPFSATKLFSEKPKMERFTTRVETTAGVAELDDTILSSADGGVTVAARLPEKMSKELRPDVDRVLKSLQITRKIAER
jgi:hypothetical protein